MRIAIGIYYTGIKKTKSVIVFTNDKLLSKLFKELIIYQYRAHI